MAIQIKLKNSVVQDSTPSTSDLPVVGELALNANINSIGGFMRASDNTIVKIFGPGSVTTPTATTTVSGISELATNTETTTGTATNRVVTPAGLNAVTVAERTTSNTNYVAKAGSTLTGVLTMPNGSNSAPAINFGDSDSGIFGGTNTVSLAAGGTTRLTADTGVSVVGTLAVTGAITSTSDLTIADKIIHSGDTNTAIRFPAADTVSVETGGSEKLRVDSSGRLLLGTSSSRAIAGTSNRVFQIEGASGTELSGISITRNSANTGGSFLSFGKSRASSVGGNTVVQSGDVLGVIQFAGADGTDIQTKGAEIKGEVDGTPGSNDMPGRLVFSTTADGAASPTTRLTINSAGNCTFTGDITTIGPITSNGNLTITREQPIISFNDSTDNPDYYIGNIDGAFRVRDTTNNSTRLDITASTTTISNNLDVGAGIDVTGAITGTAGLSIEGATVFNDAGADVDFRIEGDTEANLFYVNAGTNRVGIGTSGPNELLEVTGNCRLSSGGATRTLHMGPASAGIEYNVNGTTFIQGRTDAYPLAFRTNSTERMHINSSGNVYIGQTSGSEQLGVSSGTNSQTFSTNSTNSNGNMVQIKCSGTAKLFLGSAGSFITGQSGVTNQGIRAEGALLFAAGGHTERMRIDSSGRLLVGTTTEGNGNADALTIATSADTGMTIRSGTSSAGSIFFSDATSGNAEFTGFIQYLHNNNSLHIGTDETTRMTINNSGAVGIGTTSPAVNLDVSATSGTTQIYVRNTATSGEAAVGVQGKNSSGTTRVMLVKYDNNDSFRFATAQAVPLTFSTSDAVRLTVNSDGNVGIGTGAINVAPTAKLHIIEGTSTPAVKIKSGTSTNQNTHITMFNDNEGGTLALGVFGSSASSFGSTAAADGFISANNNLSVIARSSHIKFGVGSTPNEKMRIDSSGNVGIGTTSPAVKLHVSYSYSAPTGGLDSNNALVLSNTNAGNSVGLSMLSATNSVSFINFGDPDDGDIAGIAYFNTDNSMTFRTNINERMRIDSSGNVGIGTSSPVSNSGYGGLTLNGNNGAILSFKDSNVEKTRLALVADNTFSIQYPPGDDGIFRIDKLTVDGSNNITGANEHMRITKSGFAKHTNSAGTYFSSTGAFHEFRSTAVNAVNTVFFHAGVGNTQFGITIRTANEQNDTSHNYIDCREGGSATQRFVVYANGNVQNQNNSYGSLSDEKLKENITDANSQWDDIKALKVRNFNFTNDSNKVKCLGLVAQEAETVCPSLVFESPDQEQDVETGEITDKGTKTKSLKYSVLYMKAFKCLQEAIVKIETLEAKVAALEGA